MFTYHNFPSSVHLIHYAAAAVALLVDNGWSVTSLINTHDVWQTHSPLLVCLRTDTQKIQLRSVADDPMDLICSCRSIDRSFVGL